MVLVLLRHDHALLLRNGLSNTYWPYFLRKHFITTVSLVWLLNSEAVQYACHLFTASSKLVYLGLC